jgi:hypothetical protein
VQATRNSNGSTAAGGDESDDTSDPNAGSTPAPKKKKSSAASDVNADADGAGADDPNASGPNGSGPTATAPTAFPCTGAGIAAYADQLVKAGRQQCASAGPGVVNNANYTCMQAAINQVNPPHKDESFNIVKTLLAPNQQYPLLECTYFVQMVTAGACGTPISPNDMAWTSYPLAHEFAGKQVTGYTWIPNDGRQPVQPGDIFIYGTAAMGEDDPGHIMIVAAVIDSGHFRIAEANELNSDGSPGTDETGVVSNTRVATLNEQDFTGWFRINGR